MTTPNILTVSLDYETFYSKTYSIRDLGNYSYCHHPEFDPYLLTAATDQGQTWCGDPLDFQYAAVDKAIWIMANAGFDTTVTETLIEQGKIFAAKPVAIYDVLDLARYLGYPGNLAGATEHMLGKTLDKGVRDAAKGIKWRDMSPDQQAEMSHYATQDAVVTLELWLKFNHLWPEWERELSRLTREMCARGIPVDMAGIEADINTLENLLWKIRTAIPWQVDEDGKGALSKKAMAEECRKHGILPPKSMAKDSEEFEAWLRVHGDKYAWARAMGSYRSVNGQLKRLIGMKARSIDNEDGTGTMTFGLKYAGAHTLRDSGDAGVNVQNFARNAMFEDDIRDMKDIWTEKFDDGTYVIDPDVVYGINMRGKLMAPAGKVFGVVDLSAIEPCVTATMAEDWNMVELLMKGMDPYEAWARVHHGYKNSLPLKEVDPKLRQLCKVEVLGLGYGAGAEKLIVIAKTLAGLTLTLSEAQTIVYGFRQIPFIPALWNKLETAMRFRAGADFTIGLPSGREMLYRDVKNYGKLSAVIPRNGKMMRLPFWGGTLTENLVQGCARDVFMDRVLALNADGLTSVLRVHDEAVCVLDEATAQDDLQRMISIMSTAPLWGQDIPVRADGHLCKRYTKA